MQTYTYVSKGKFELMEKPKPVLMHERDAIVKVTLASICSSDLHIKHGSVPRAVPGITVGHEMVTDCDHWCVGMRPDDPLAEKEFIKKEDLIGKPLILPERMNVQSELANWFGKDFSKLQIAFTSNLGTNAGVMAANGLGYPISIEGAAKYWREDILVQRRISPEITTSTVIAWRRNIPYSLAVRKMIEEINAFQA